ncbi:MAG TPA: hypothetical protein VME46_07285 [Acidimicrobiales bacterium]|nr:hypothetical protein [Acidimicrobiales bacterium]HUB70399.1 hypothetical protein [Acidimicrobiales bacterium]
MSVLVIELRRPWEDDPVEEAALTGHILQDAIVAGSTADNERQRPSLPLPAWKDP